MKQKLTLETTLAAIDSILGLLPEEVRKAEPLWRELDQKLDLVLDATKIDEVRHRNLIEVSTPPRNAASRLSQSMINARRSGPMRGDWKRFAERDLAVLKDELMALRESMLEEADFLRFACLRAQLSELGGTNPERLFNELHEAGAISERTWVLLMSQPNSWREALKDKEISKHLAQISAWLLDLQEVRGGRLTQDAEEGKSRMEWSIPRGNDPD